MGVIHEQMKQDDATSLIFMDHQSKSAYLNKMQR
jgi:hypothetical protein